jgi:NitT/TauT family transport system permease protein
VAELAETWGRVLAGGRRLPIASAYGLPILSFIVGVILWQVAVMVFDVPGYLIPSPLAIAGAFTDGDVNWVKHTVVTLTEALTGFVIGVLVGYGIAMVITLSPILNKILLPYIVGLQALPKVAIAPVLYVVMGFSDASRILLVVILTFFPIAINVSTGLTDVDRNHVYLLRSLGAGKLTIFRKVQLPNSLPYFFDGLRIAVSGCLVGAIVAEFVSSSEGLGFLILNSQYTFNTTTAFAAFVLLTALGLVLYALVVLVGRRLMPWYRAG